jgi:hypothetical protein
MISSREMSDDATHRIAEHLWDGLDRMSGDHIRFLIQRAAEGQTGRPDA